MIAHGSRDVARVDAEDDAADQDVTPASTAEAEDDFYAHDDGYEEDIPFDTPPLSLSEWERRDDPPPDRLLGSFITATSRMLLVGDTGIGKTNLAIAIGMHVAAGRSFLHWPGGKPRKVLYVDGEMSGRVLRDRLFAEVKRIGHAPKGFHALCSDDAYIKPLNTREGRMHIWRTIGRMGGVDLVIFDNVMSLVSGSMVGEEPWAEVLPFVRSLTRRGSSQIWLHHTGHDGDRSYGTKTREWQLDTVAVMEKVTRPNADVSFKLSFRKARERTPANRRDFQDCEIALVDDRWEGSIAAGNETATVSPKALGFLEALRAACDTGGVVSKDAWGAECSRSGLIDETKAASARAQFSRYRKELLDAGMIAVEGDLVRLTGGKK